MRALQDHVNLLPVIHPARDELYKMEQRITELEEECDALLRGEYICSRCGIRKNAETVEADF